jgi:hypothetical protein
MFDRCLTLGAIVNADGVAFVSHDPPEPQTTRADRALPKGHSVFARSDPAPILPDVQIDEHIDRHSRIGRRGAQLVETLDGINGHGYGQLAGERGRTPALVPVDDLVRNENVA